MSNQINNSFIHLSSKTWIKDSNGLFDYESNNIKNYEFFLSDSFSITRNGNDLNSTKGAPSENYESLFNVTKSNDSIYSIETKIDNNFESIENQSYLNNKIWYIINNESRVDEQNNKNIFQNINKNYHLMKNDIIKLGRVKYIISEVNIDNNDNIEEKLGELNLNEKKENEYNYINELNYKVRCPFDLVCKANCLSDEKNEIKNSEDKYICKICYTEEMDTLNNPMIHLCHCKGGLNYAHFECIKEWMKTKLIVYENRKKTVRSYYIFSFNCEICKTPYPSKFKLNNNDKIYELIDIEKPLNTNYIVLESLNQVKNNCNIKSIHIVSLNNNDDIIIGRGRHCDIVVKDISVSRNHSKIKYNKKDNTLLIKDLKSKFGTLVLIQSSFEIKEPIQFQIGRTYFNASPIYNGEFKNYQIQNKVFDDKNLEKIEEIKNENNYETLETNSKEKEILENDNNNMEIEEEL